jgi:hypothetical protein
MIFCWHTSLAIAYLVNTLLYNQAAQQLIVMQAKKPINNTRTGKMPVPQDLTIFFVEFSRLHLVLALANLDKFSELKNR